MSNSRKAKILNDTNKYTKLAFVISEAYDYASKVDRWKSVERSSLFG
jgi:hypothetical protein